MIRYAGRAVARRKVQTKFFRRMAPLDSRLDRGLADKALKDVSEWLGFSSVMEYLDELSIWGEKIFLFAKITRRKRKTSDV